MFTGHDPVDFDLPKRRIALRCDTFFYGYVMQIDNSIGLRIAVALERIADALDRKSSKGVTPFPWAEVDANTMHRVQEGLMNEQTKWGGMVQYRWPLSCEDLVAIGPVGIRKFRMVGNKSIAEIREKLDSLGFQWNQEPKSKTHVNP